MKKIIYIKWFIPFIASVMLWGCTDFDELNSNPTQSTKMDPNLQVSTVQSFYSSQSQRVWRYLIYPAGFMNQWSGEWALTFYGGTGRSNPQYFADIWDSFYDKIIPNAVDLVERTKDQPEYANVNAVGRILKVMYFQRLTDIFGDVPYFNAGKAYYTGVLTSEYDKQEDIYKDFFNELDIAVGQLNSNGGILTGDLYYNGNIDSWKKFANSLKLRIAMRLVKIEPELAKTKAGEAIAAGVFTSNADICFIRHENLPSDETAPAEAGEGAGNGFAYRLNYGNSTECFFRPARELIGEMDKWNDPRITIYGRSYTVDNSRTDITEQIRALKGNYKDMALPAQTFVSDANALTSAVTIDINGVATEVTARGQFLQPSTLIRAYGSPYIHMTYAEVAFLRAEYEMRWGGGLTSAQGYFKSGLEAAVRQWNTLFGAKIEETAILDFAKNNTLNAGAELVQINTQLWVLNYLDPFEAWANWRRTGIPNITFTVLDGNDTSGQIPRRLEYPADEQLKNTKAWQAAVDRMGGNDDWLKRVWWDKQ